MDTSVFNVEVYPKLPRKKSKAVPEGSDPIPQDAYVTLVGIKLEGLHRIMSEALDKAFDKSTEMMRRGNQHLAGLQQEAR